MGYKIILFSTFIGVMFICLFSASTGIYLGNTNNPVYQLGLLPYMQFFFIAMWLSLIPPMIYIIAD